MSLWNDLRDIPLVDQHAHNVRRAGCALPFEAAFTEATDPKVWEEQAPFSLFYQRSLSQLSELFGCSAESESVKAWRESRSLEELTGLCLQASGMSHLLLDDGLSPDQVMPWQWHEQFVTTRRLLRLEHLAEDLLRERLSFDDFEERYWYALTHLPPEVVGFKTIAAYRGGLRVPFVSRNQAREAYHPRPTRVHRSDFYHYLLHLGFQAAQDQHLPVQLHTGFGDPDLALEEANPLHLRPLLETYSCPFVLLHTGYPYFRESGFLCSVYHNVWVDFGLAIPFLSHHGMVSALRGLLELAPLNRVLYSSDASLIPELFYLGALNGRRVLAEVLEQTVQNGDLPENQALPFGQKILRDNSLQLYKLEKH